MPPKKKSSSKPATSGKPGPAKRGRPKKTLPGGVRPGTFVCPECGFVAKHAMGLGRHRSSRHGVQSLRAKRDAAAGTTTVRKTSRTKVAATGRSAPASLTCPECGFVAKHAMGIGRHRSSRHGVLSLRAKREGASGAGSGKKRGPTTQPAPEGWLTRRQAAAQAKVHYNTVRIWERSGKLGTMKRGNETLVSAADFAKLQKGRSAKGTPRKGRAPSAPISRTAAVTASMPSFPRIGDMSGPLNQLADALEALARNIRPRKRRGRPPKQR